MSKETLLANLREIPDFPIPGILFYDVTTLFKSAECMQEMLDTLYEMYKDKGITKVVGIESRGFIMGGALAARLGAGFVMARKPGKLPAEVLEEIAKAVDGSMKIFVDGGIRSGTDVFKALALGADAVIIARPFVTAVYGGGREGVEAYIQKIGSELADTMAMCGVSSLSEITRDCVRV